MKTYVCGHRNPDVDSVMSAYALADLRRRTGLADVEAICAGRLPGRAKWVFDHFKLKPIRVRRDVYVRVRDLMAPDVPMIDAALPLALRGLAKLLARDRGQSIAVDSSQQQSVSGGKRTLAFVLVLLAILLALV